MNQFEVSTADAPAPRNTPPRPRLAFRIGVVGHRPNRLEHANITALERAVRHVLIAVRDAVRQVRTSAGEVYAGEAPVLKATSPMAEGSDRLFAEQAISLGFELCCVMPFPQAEFENDFADQRALERDSLPRFRKLLARAENETRLTRFELDGDRADEEGAYATCGHVVLNQSDLLVVVWDGDRQGKRGGTEEIFDDARRRGTPVVWIDAYAPHRWQIVDSERPLAARPPDQRATPDREATGDDLQQTVCSLLELPRLEPGEGHRAAGKGLLAQQRLAEFYAEHRPAQSPAVVWKVFQSVVADGCFPQFSPRAEDVESTVREEWQDDPQAPAGRMAVWLRPYFAWPDQLAVSYADRYRSAFILAFSLSAAAVGLALFPYGLQLTEHSYAERICMALEFGAIVAVLAVVVTGRRRRWHERWLDYRLTAELVRHSRLVAPLGGGRPFPQVPAHWSTYGQPGATWMAWYVRAVERDLGLPSMIVDNSHLKTCLEHLRNLVTLQIEYHEQTAGRCHRIEHRLHHGGIALLLVTLLSCGLHLLFSKNSEEVLHRVWLSPSVLTFICGVFPALGAAMAGISNQGEFRRIARRSEAMAQQLGSLSGRIERLRAQIEEGAIPGGQLSNQAAGLAGELARLLVNEVLDWRVVFLDRPLDPPA